MESLVNKRNWWTVLIVGGILAFAVTLIQQKWQPDSDLAAFLIAIVILAIAFYWVYSIDRQGLWWALIPAMALVALLAAGIVAYLTPPDASGSSPYGVITLGLGAAVIGWVMKRPSAKLVLYFIAIITLLVGDPDAAGRSHLEDWVNRCRSPGDRLPDLANEPAIDKKVKQVDLTGISWRL